MLDDAFQASTDAALIDQAQRPIRRKLPEPSFSAWSTVTAAPKGLAAGAAQGGASGLEVLDFFSKIDVSPEAMAASLTPEGRAEQQKKAEKLIREGFTGNELTRSLRNVAKDYMPDPTTAHAAEQAVSNLFRVGGKAITAAVTFGNIPGAVIAGAEEGFTQSEDLRQQGVDLETRTKVGLVTAGTNALGFALPVAGKTWSGTVGLALAGGPASYVAQNAATREILKNANYDQLANQYDPFDPVGLALSTLLPLGFGALAMRGAKAARFDAETVDAARVTLLREQMDSARVTPPDDLAGAAAHNQAMARAIDQVADGARADVSDIAPAGARITEEMAGRLRTVQRALDEIAPAEKAPTKAAMQAMLDEAALAKADTKPAGPAQAAGDAGKSEAVGIDRAAMDLEARMPDLQVQLDGMDAPMKVSELMAKVRDEAKLEGKEASLLEVAAQCFLRSAAG